MNDILALLHCLTPYVSNTAMRQMKRIVQAVLCIPDRVTMLSIARWTERGGSYRIVQRWYHTPLDWAAMMWAVVQVHLLDPAGEYLPAGVTWVAAGNGAEYTGGQWITVAAPLEKIPVFLRADSALRGLWSSAASEDKARRH